MNKRQMIILYVSVILGSFLCGCLINGLAYGIGVLIGWMIGAPIGIAVAGIYLFIKKKWHKAKESEEKS